MLLESAAAGFVCFMCLCFGRKRQNAPILAFILHFNLDLTSITTLLIFLIVYFDKAEEAVTKVNAAINSSFTTKLSSSPQCGKSADNLNLQNVVECYGSFKHCKNTSITAFLITRVKSCLYHTHG
ncbi:hypothetical protein BaRGS_00023827 [Batillaria attramentaria]|uniref:SSD domain-containing protein n=1 Tax=Batillaria attramentaria TaxID=370345 RepID=A0ABD0KD07_9CAEN